MSSTKDFFKNQTKSSRIKALIISEYFPKYCSIISKTHKGRIRYMDLFAGPGIYEDGNWTTPMLIGKACQQNPYLSQNVELVFNDKQYCHELRDNFLSSFPSGTFKHMPSFGDKIVGEDTGIRSFLMKKFLDKDGKNKYPTVLFIDPFGYKGVETSVLAEFLKNQLNEIFLFVNIRRIHPALSNDKFDELMQYLFPTSVDQLRNDKLYKRSVVEKLNLIINNLGNEYQKIVGSKVYYTPFAFKEEENEAVSHYILHFTKHHRGFDLIKQIYNDFDNVGAILHENGTYTFDVKKMDDVPQSSSALFGDLNILQLSGQLKADFKGQKLSAITLYDSHQASTKFSRHHYVKTLRYMVDQGDIMAIFTDKVEHRVSVLLNEFCILQFK